jgi:hypothetical protein
VKNGIFKLNRAYEIWRWLCQMHLNAMRAAGWTVQERKKPTWDITCDLCQLEQDDIDGF